MAEEYLLKVVKDCEKDVQSWIHVSKPPPYLRLATLAPLSNYGYAPGVEGCVLRLDQRGIVIGAEGREDAPREFVPWQNVSYVADGTVLAQKKGKA